jgi:two-component system chemotaxis response regulator CheB
MSAAAPASRGAIRVFVVDDSRIVRRLLISLLKQAEGFEVVGEADGGTAALEQVPALAPHVVTLDVNMPGLDGVATLRALRARQPDLQVVMFSSVTVSGARTSLAALEAGAADVLAKPSAEHGPEAFREAIAELVERIRAVAHRTADRRVAGGLTPSYTPFVVPARLSPHQRLVPLEVVVVATSTGGPNALVELFSALPRALPVPILVVQHMPPLFTGLLATRLDALGGPPVREAAGGEALRPGEALLAPGDKHLGLRRTEAGVVARVFEGPRENGCRPAADVLFRDAAEVFGPAVLGVVLTGMGVDGHRGAERIREGGGRILAQDEASSAVWGMPGTVVRAGLAEAVLPLSGLADAIVGRLVRRPILRGIDA